MATTRIKDISTTVTSLASDDYIAVDGATNGTRKMVRGSIYTDVASAFTGAPATYDICPLNSGTGKIDATYLPTSGDTPKGEWNASSNSPTLADGSGVAGDYYDVTTAGSQDLGSGSITFTVGDVVKYNGSTWYKIDSVANFLDGYSTAATSRAALEVNSIDEDAQANALKVTAPALYFNGTSSVVTVADDDKFSFTDGTDDLPFSISAFVKMTDATNFTIASKYSSSNEWRFYVNAADDLSLALTDGTNSAFVTTDTDLSGYEGQWIHVGMSYAGAGPSAASGNAFSAAADGMVLYINGVAVPITATSGSYAGMSSTSDPVTIGMHAGQYGKGHIRNVQIFNRELTATEVAELAKGNELGFADEWGDHTTNRITDGDMEAAGTTNWSVTDATVSKETTSPHGGSRNLKAILNGATSGTVQTAATPISAGKRYRAMFWYRTGGTAPTAYRFRGNGSSWQEISVLAASASWTYHEVEFVANSDTNGKLVFYIDVGTDADTYIEVDDFELVTIGTLADFRSERFDSSTGKWYDLSDNAFVGTNSGATLVGREVPVYETGTWTPSITFGGGSTAITYTTQEGLYTRVGNTVWVSAYVLLSAKGSDTGTALINGLPFTASNTAASSQSFTVGNAANAANLTSAITAYATDNGTTINLVDWGATGSAVLDDTNFAATTALSISGTYQIQ